MLISHRYRFIYTKTAKTAGTSVESFFERFCMPDGEWEQQHAREEYVSPAGIIGYRGQNKPEGVTWWNHMSAASIRELIGTEIWDSYFKFCVVRNPFEKSISGFAHLGKDHQTMQDIGNDKKLTQNMNEEQLRFYSYLKTGKGSRDSDKFLINGKFCLNDVIRYESLESDIKRICHILQLPYQKEYLPMFKKGFRKQSDTVEKLYTEESKKLVEQTFDYELKHFGYSYPKIEKRGLLERLKQKFFWLNSF